MVPKKTKKYVPRKTILVKNKPQLGKIPRSEAQLLAEYNALRSEIIRYSTDRKKLLHYSILILGFFVAVGSNKVLLSMYPTCGLCVALSWIYNDWWIFELAGYIRDNIESELDGIGWEKYLTCKRLNLQLVEKKGRMSHTGFRYSEAYLIVIFQIISLIIMVSSLSPKTSCFLIKYFCLPSQSFSQAEVILYAVIPIIFTITLLVFRGFKMKIQMKQNYKRN